jgi:hypothetical protein
MIYDPNSTDDLQVGHDSIPLHSIFPLVKGKHTVECILDSDSGNEQVQLGISQCLLLPATSTWTAVLTTCCLHRVDVSFEFRKLEGFWRGHLKLVTDRAHNLTADIALWKNWGCMK